MDVVWKLTNQWFKHFGKYLSHSISDQSSAGHYRSEGGVWLMDLEEAIELPEQLKIPSTCGTTIQLLIEIWVSSIYTIYGIKYPLIPPGLK